MELSQIKVMIERALADGRLSRQESETIKAAIYSDKKVTPEECELFRLLQEKVWLGEIKIDAY
ncbi:MAG: hypothetical protein AB4426_25435 [Xenococcaceae cyanobacterium]